MRTDAPPAAARPGRPSADRADAISRAILDAATGLFLANGFGGVSMEGVAAAAGVPKTTLYKRYVDKRALLRAVIAAEVARWSAVNAARNWMLSDDLAQRLARYAEWMIGWARMPEVRAFSALASAAWPSPEEAGSRRDIIGFDSMVDLIERDIRRYGPAAGIEAKEPRTVATALMAMVAGRLQIDPAGDSCATAFARTAVDLLLRGAAAW